MLELDETKQNTNIFRADVVKIVHQQLGGKINYMHVMSVVSILLEEMARDLFKKGKFYIGNFGWFIFKRLPSRGYFNFQTDKVEQSVGNKILRFKISKKLKRTILDNLDIERTFPNDNETT